MFDANLGRLPQWTAIGSEEREREPRPSLNSLETKNSMHRDVEAKQRHHASGQRFLVCPSRRHRVQRRTEVPPRPAPVLPLLAPLLPRPAPVLPRPAPVLPLPAPVLPRPAPVLPRLAPAPDPPRRAPIPPLHSET